MRLWTGRAMSPPCTWCAIWNRSLRRPWRPSSNGSLLREEEEERMRSPTSSWWLRFGVLPWPAGRCPRLTAAPAGWACEGVACSGKGLDFTYLRLQIEIKAADRQATLAELGEVLVEVSKGGFERLAVVRVRCRHQLVHNAGAG